MTIVMKNLRKIPYGFEASLLMDIGQEFFIVCYGFLLFFSLLLFSTYEIASLEELYPLVMEQEELANVGLKNRRHQC